MATSAYGTASPSDDSMQGTGGGRSSAMGTVRRVLGLETQDSVTLAKLNAMFEEAKRARQPYDAEAWLNVAFFLSEQYVEYPEEDDIKNGSAQAIRRIKRGKNEEDTPRPVFNKIQNYIYTAHNETLQDKPSLDVLPANDDFTASMDADVNKAYLNYVMEPVVANWDMQLSRAALWALIAPSGWLKWTWDPQLKHPSIQPASFFDVYPDPYARDFGQARYVFHTMFMAVEQLEDAFGVKMEEGEAGVTDELRTQLLRGMGSAPLVNGIEVRELWQKPSFRHPRGFYALFTAKRILKLSDALPYNYLIEGQSLPFTQLGSLLRPDSLMYTSPVTALRPAQMVWNKFIAQAIMTNDHFANLKWWIPEELNLQKDPDGSPHQILRGNAGSANLQPTILSPQGMPDQSRLLDMFEQQMMHVVSVHEVSQGQVPGRVEAAKAIELLKSSDEGMYKHLLDTIDSSISQGGYQILMMAKEFESPKKMIIIHSPDTGDAIVKHWHAEAVHPGTQVRVVRMSGLGRTRAQRLETLNLLWDKHVITDPDVFARLMDMPFPSFTDPAARDVRLARAENIEMSTHIATRPNSWDNHAVHIREHNEFRKTQEYRALGMMEKSIFEWHVTGHEQLQLVEAAKMARLLAVQQGMPQAAPASAPSPEGAAPQDPNAMAPDPGAGPPPAA